jgi:hypothetical protein
MAEDGSVRPRKVGKVGDIAAAATVLSYNMTVCVVWVDL